MTVDKARSSDGGADLWLGGLRSRSARVDRGIVRVTTGSVRLFRCIGVLELFLHRLGKRVKILEAGSDRLLLLLLVGVGE